jgi:hypothetical protein
MCNHITAFRIWHHVFSYMVPFYQPNKKTSMFCYHRNLKSNGQIWRKKNWSCYFGSVTCRRDDICGPVTRGPGFNSRRYQIFWEVVSLEWVPLSLLRITEELPEWKSSGLSLENRDYWPWESVVPTMRHPLPANVGPNFADKRWSLGRYSSLANSSHKERVVFSYLQEDKTYIYKKTSDEVHCWTVLQIKYGPATLHFPTLPIHLQVDYSDGILKWSIH